VGSVADVEVRFICRTVPEREQIVKKKLKTTGNAWQSLHVAYPDIAVSPSSEQ